MSRIVWTNEEKRAIQNALVDLIAFEPKLSNKELLRRAQEQVIPYERRTKITDQRVFNYKGMINAARDTVKLAATRADAFKPRVEVPVPMEFAKPTVGDLFEQLVDALTERVLAKVVERIGTDRQVTLDDAFGHPLDQLDAMFETLHPRKPRKPTCLVVGLNGAQMESIKRRTPHIDFKFLSAEEALSHSVSVRDHTVLMTKFINHQCQNKYRKHPNLHYCNGGVSELHGLLNIVCKEAA